MWHTPKDRDKIVTPLRETGSCDNVEITFQRKDGQLIIGMVSARRILLNGMAHIISVTRDISERKRMEAILREREEKYRYQASTDALTGATNRRSFLELAANEIQRARQFNHPLALAVLDIDHFKAINDTYGHAVGDQVLLALTHICMQQLRARDTFARFGGDEFALLFPETTCAQAHRIMERIGQFLASQPLDVGGHRQAISISVGIAQLASAEDVLDRLLERADQALYQAKAAGRNRVVSGAQPAST